MRKFVLVLFFLAILFGRNAERNDSAQNYTAQCKELFTFRASNPDFHVIQGGYFDGEKFYIAANKKGNAVYEQTTILVLSKEGELLKESNPLFLDHANNITYNPNINRLLISHCTNQDNHGNWYSLVNPDTFEITAVGNQKYTFFAMTYSFEKNMYASARAAGKILDIWDENFNHVKTVPIECPDTMAQGMFCDNGGIYFLRGANHGLSSEIAIYDWNGNFMQTIPIVHPEYIEPENINIADGVIYLVCNDWEKNCGVVYQLLFTPA